MNLRYLLNFVDQDYFIIKQQINDKKLGVREKESTRNPLNLRMRKKKVCNTKELLEEYHI